MSPNISVRESIRWLPNEASEPTTTLVLTSAENRFVDIRILRPTGEDNLCGGGITPSILITTWKFVVL